MKRITVLSKLAVAALGLVLVTSPALAQWSAGPTASTAVVTADRTTSTITSTDVRYVKHDA
ncbi:MAG: hypothetical protein ACOC7N_05575, partial [Chloroflexota bacterium]